jgi:hypothetical protein
MVARRSKMVLLALWELPQNVLGAGLLAAQFALGHVEATRLERERLFVRSRHMAVSLGFFVFWAQDDSRWFRLDSWVKDHEYGHSFQSRLLGPLYLPLVGVPSTMRVLYAIAYRELTGRRWGGYFDGYPEDWADRLGGVRRD